ncbi:MAG: hypothetical protein KF761_08030 [Salinibacterium sp.]|nr:hypothetical protein [Salinibacterium sp.]
MAVPGRLGQPMHTTLLRLRLHNLGIPNLTNRGQTIREMLRQTSAIIATEYGAAWQHYAALGRQPCRPPRPSE